MARPAPFSWQAWTEGDVARKDPTDDRRKERSVHRWYGLDEVPEHWGASVVTIGVFDGVHRGHQRIVGRAVELAADRAGQGAGNARLPVVVVTFDPHPDEVVRPGSHPPFLSTARRRAELLAGLGVDAVCMLPFTYEFSQLSPDEFVRTVLADRLHAAAVVVGENFRFGHRAAGDVPLLAKLGEKYDYTTEGVPLLVADGITISSSYIRERQAVHQESEPLRPWLFFAQRRQQIVVDDASPGQHVR